MNEPETRICSACSLEQTEEAFSKRQWSLDQKTIRCTKCVSEKRNDPLKMKKKAAADVIRKKELFKNREPVSPETTKCMACDDNESKLAIVVRCCPLCAPGEPFERTKIAVHNSHECIEKALLRHIEKGNVDPLSCFDQDVSPLDRKCQHLLTINEIVTRYGLRRPVSAYDDGGVDEVVNSMTMRVTLDTTWKEVARFHERRAFTCSDDNPSFNLYPKRGQTIRDALYDLSSAKTDDCAVEASFTGA